MRGMAYTDFYLYINPHGHPCLKVNPHSEYWWDNFASNMLDRFLFLDIDVGFTYVGDNT